MSTRPEDVPDGGPGEVVQAVPGGVHDAWSDAERAAEPILRADISTVHTPDWDAIFAAAKRAPCACPDSPSIIFTTARTAAFLAESLRADRDKDPGPKE